MNRLDPEPAGRREAALYSGLAAGLFSPSSRLDSVTRSKC